MQQVSNTKMNSRIWVFMIAFALVWYGNGAAFVESFVNYPSWHLVGANEFTTYHQFIGPRVVAFLVAPALLGTVFSMALIWLRPVGVPAWTVWSTIVLQIILWASTVGIQVPIQLTLSEGGFSEDLVERLITTNFWLRRIPYAVCAGLFLWMAKRVFQTHTQERAA